jgi:hypothetical protein
MQLPERRLAVGCPIVIRRLIRDVCPPLERQACYAFMLLGSSRLDQPFCGLDDPCSAHRPCGELDV